jgi:hypothetical protein
MLLLYYWPMIVWMGMFEAAQKDMRVRVKARQ